MRAVPDTASRTAVRACLLLALALPACGASRSPVSDVEEALLRARGHASEAAATLADLHVPADRLPSREERLAAGRAWARLVDGLVALDVVGGAHGDWWRRHGGERSRAFAVARAAWLAKYRHALEVLDLVTAHPSLRKVLNDAVPELGLPAGTLDALERDVLDLDEGAKWAAWQLVASTLARRPPAALADALAEDEAVVGRFALGRGEALTLRSAYELLRSEGQAAWFPVQSRAAEWMGDTKVARRGISLVSREQARELARRLEPGDILLTRREWYVSNVGLPGWWSHAALHVGTPDDRRRWAADEGVRAWVRAQGRADGDFEELLRDRVRKAHALASRADAHGDPVRVLEAIGEGVTFSSIEHAADCDAIVALRLRLSPARKAAALLRAFEYAGRPYDYDFDFRTDSALVCTELVCKAYEAAGEGAFIVPVMEVMGRPVVPANDIARRFDEELGTDRQQMDLVAFLDGDEAGGVARESDAAAFRTSWQRPKWHVVEQALRGE